MPTLSAVVVMGGAGLGAGVLAGLFGIGGATLIVPLFLSMEFSPLQAIGTASLSIVCASASGTWQNWRMGRLQFGKVWRLGVPAILLVQVGVGVARVLPNLWLLLGFAAYLLINAWLVGIRGKLSADSASTPKAAPRGQASRREIMIGSLAGLLSGLFGVGGGMVLVPLQLLGLKESIKPAIHNSLAVVTLTGISACIGHGWAGNVVWTEGMIVAVAGAIGAQVGTRILPLMGDRAVTLLLQIFLVSLAIYTIYKAVLISSP